MHRAELIERIREGEDWLIKRILRYATSTGYTKYTSTLEEAWRLSIRGLSVPLVEMLASRDRPDELRPDENYAADPVGAFGILEARKHRERGVDLAMFLALMKYYRRAYLDLCSEAGWEASDAELARAFVHGFFDRVELGFCSEWTRDPDQDRLEELQAANRRITNEKNKYLTLFESLGTPVVLFDHQHLPVDSNHAAVQLFERAARPGSRYYVDEQKPFGLPWLQEEIARFCEGEREAVLLERQVTSPEGPRDLEVRLKAMLDVSGKFTGVTAVLVDLTALRTAERERERVIGELRQALAEVKTLSGFIPICSGCKQVRDDQGYWQAVETYVSQRSDALFSHGLCPGCLDRLYPEYATAKARGGREEG